MTAGQTQLGGGYGHMRFVMLVNNINKRMERHERRYREVQGGTRRSASSGKLVSKQVFSGSY